MRCLYREQIYRCGNYVDISIYPVWNTSRTNTRRKSKYKPTSEDQDRLNRHNAEMKVVRLINSNFTKNDLKIELTYRNEFLPETEEHAKKDIHNFFRRVRRALAKLGKELKYIYCIEGKRYHYHMVMTGGLSVQEISAIWGKGIVEYSALEFDSEVGCMALGKYIVKSPRFYKSFVCSKNLVRPVALERTGEISQKMVEKLAGLTDCPSEFNKMINECDIKTAKSWFNPHNSKYYLKLYGKTKKGESNERQRKKQASQRK